MYTAKTTRFNETMGTSGLRGALERRGVSALRVCTARPYFNREIRTKRGKEGYTRRDAGAGEGRRKKRGRRGARKKLESRKSKDTEGKVSIRHDMQAKPR